MKRRHAAVYLGASGMWAIAVLGAIGVARWLALDSTGTILLVVAVVLVAIVGTFIPAVQLGLGVGRRRDQ